MTTVGFVVHPNRSEAKELAASSKKLLESLGHSVVYLEDNPSAVEQCQLILSLGGDGTMLRAVEIGSLWELPILGVNLGRLGYLTEIEPKDLGTALARYFGGDYRIQRRMTLSVTVTGNPELHSVWGRHDDDLRPIRNATALNELVVERLHSGHVIQVSVEIAGTHFLRYDTDGLIVATPTGSTGYNLSARGPIASPTLEAILLTPISPHMLFDRSMLLAPTESIELKMCDGPPASVMIDGQNVATISSGDSVLCKRATRSAHLITFDNRRFHEILKVKFGLDSKEMGV